jgi:predicted transposase YdaD
MLKDILRETPAFQQILEEGREEGRQEVREEGLELERQRHLQSFRPKVLDLVRIRYSELVALAQEKIALIQDVEVLEDLFLKIAIADSIEDARNVLLSQQ